jgi:hypothetical protein
MATTETLKKKVIKHMNSVDLAKLSMQELSTYVFTLNTLIIMDKPDYMGPLLGLTSAGLLSGKEEKKED